MTKYHVLFTKKLKMKVTRIKNNCIVRIKFMNKIQHIVTQRNHIVFLYIFELISSQFFLWLILRIIGLCGYLVARYPDNFL